MFPYISIYVEYVYIIYLEAAGRQVFWAMAADVKLLEDYGIDVNAPLEHKAAGLICWEKIWKHDILTQHQQRHVYVINTYLL